MIGYEEELFITTYCLWSFQASSVKYDNQWHSHALPLEIWDRSTSEMHSDWFNAASFSLTTDNFERYGAKNTKQKTIYLDIEEFGRTRSEHLGLTESAHNPLCVLAFFYQFSCININFWRRLLSIRSSFLLRHFQNAVWFETEAGIRWSGRPIREGVGERPAFFLKNTIYAYQKRSNTTVGGALDINGQVDRSRTWWILDLTSKLKLFLR